MVSAADMACLHVIQAAEAEVQAVAEQTPKDPGAGFKGKKSKAAAKQGTAKRQWDILRDSGIPESEISEFRWTIFLLLVSQATPAGMHKLHALHSSPVYTWLLIKLFPKAVVFPLLCFSSLVPCIQVTRIFP